VTDRDPPQEFGRKHTDTGISLFSPIRALHAGRGGIVVAVIAAAVPLLLVAQTFRPSDYSGEELFGRYCASCHGPLAHGDGPVAATLRKRVPDLTRISIRSGNQFPAQDIREIIDGRSPVLSHGTRLMPVWGREFWVDEGADIEAERNAREVVERLVEYLESIQEQ
jgi:mono/diheme cytochrome c family protein